MASKPDNKSAANFKSDDSALIRELALLLDETSLTEIEIERAGLRVRVARNISIAASMPANFQHAAVGARRANRLRDAGGDRRSGKASGRGPLADGRHRLFVARARRQAVHRGRHQGLGRTDAV